MASKRHLSTRSTHPLIRQNASSQARFESHTHETIQNTSQIELHPAFAPQRQTLEYPTLGVPPPLQIGTPQAINETHLYACSPQHCSDQFPHTPERPARLHTGLLTPQTPSSAPYIHELLQKHEVFSQPDFSHWPQPEVPPIGLGIHSDMSHMPQPQMGLTWTPDFKTLSASCTIADGYPPFCTSPEPFGPSHTLQVPNCVSNTLHVRAVPSLSFSDNPIQDADFWTGIQHQWYNFQESEGPRHVPHPSPHTSVVEVSGMPPFTVGEFRWEVA